MRFHFIHAADLHIDSPLAALGAKDAAVAETFRAAGRRAVERLVAKTIESGAAFLLLAGDVFDREWRDVSTGLFFVRELGKLDRAGVKTFLIKGNHDADSVVAKSLAYPASVHLFDGRRSATQLIEPLRVAIHGRSFSERNATEDFLNHYPPGKDGWLNIGLLHTSLDGSRGHDSYAPCKVADLARFGYDYWALGHIHAHAVVERDPWIVYPGNVQGRHARETGPKGAMRVTVEDGRVVAADHFPVDSARWAHERIDISGIDDDDAIAEAVSAALASAHRGADGLPLAIRLTLAGETAAHARLLGRLADVSGQWRADAQALAHRHAEDFWIEKIRLDTRSPLSTAPPEADGLDVAGLLASAAEDPALAAEIAGLIATLKGKAPAGLTGLDDLLARPPQEWAARARDLLLSARA